MAQGGREKETKRFEGKESFKSSEEKKARVFSNKYLVFYESDRVSPEKRHELSDDDIIDDKSH
jgi:D-lyxose ketol-isomerase